MPLPQPNLDDRTFEELVAEMRSRIPYHAPEWTNHNPSDPGITLVELFAYFGDALLYRLNRVSAANRRTFLRLLEGPDRSLPADGDLARATREAVLRLREPTRAVTPADIEELVLDSEPAVARAVVVAGRDLESGNPSPKPGHVSVVVVPHGTGPTPLPEPQLLERVAAHLEPRRLLGTRLHVVAPLYVPVSVRLEVVPHPGADPERIRTQVIESLEDSLHPLRGAPEGTGWPLGRDVPVSDLYRWIAEIQGVDHLRRRRTRSGKAGQDELAVPARQAFRKERNDRGELVAVRLRAGELVDVRLDPADIAISSPVERGAAG